ncbi:MAG: hypothetical protein IBX44_02400 [Sulfurospirillum sp.]|nr:hypothetical protein [Sulfurospirillum sp.]
MIWLNELKVAVINNDIIKIEALIQEIPQINDLQKAQEALSLIQLAIEKVGSEREKTLKLMQNIKKTKTFLQS